jgi:parallel beta-helix repeat protein
MIRRPWRPGLGVLTLALSLGCKPIYVETPLPTLVGAPDANSTLIGCEQAAAAITVTGSAHLDPACTYGGGITIGASNVTFDCRGAHVESAHDAGGAGILVAAPVDIDLADVTVRNCVVKGFTNGVRVRRTGFKTLTAGHEYDHGFSNIVIENSHVYATHGSGIFVDGFVTGVTIRDVEIQGAGSVGVYLEAGSMNNVIDGNVISNNGYNDTDPAGVPFTLGTTSYRYISTGREGIAVDGSRNNLIVNNRLDNNAAGGVFLYKNCGEYATQRPDQWFPRNYGANDNVIEGNTITNGPVGVWVGSRMSQNPRLWDCSDPAYFVSGFKKIVLDHASGNTIRSNTFAFLRDGVRVEDDGTTVQGNHFSAHVPAFHAVVVGTAYRGDIGGHPVMNTVVQDNDATIDGNPFPYATIPGADPATTSFVDNLSAGSPVGPPDAPLPQPPLDPFLLVKRFWKVT